MHGSESEATVGARVDVGNAQLPHRADSSRPAGVHQACFWGAREKRPVQTVQHLLRWQEFIVVLALFRGGQRWHAGPKHTFLSLQPGPWPRQQTSNSSPPLPPRATIAASFSPRPTHSCRGSLVKVLSVLSTSDLQSVRRLVTYTLPAVSSAAAALSCWLPLPLSLDYTCPPSELGNHPTQRHH